MPTNPWSPDSQYLSTVLNEPDAIPSHAAAAAQAQAQAQAQPTSYDPRPSSTQLQQHQHQQQNAHQGPFTAAQRSAQARGKTFASGATHAATTCGGGGGSGSNSSSSSSRAQLSEAESYASRQLRNEAAAILDSQEMLLWYAAARHESVAQTREFYRRVVLGVRQQDPVWREAWQHAVAEGHAGGSPRPGPRGKGKGRDRDREREREREKDVLRKRGSVGEGS